MCKCTRGHLTSSGLVHWSSGRMACFRDRSIARLSRYSLNWSSFSGSIFKAAATSLFSSSYRSSIRRPIHNRITYVCLNSNKMPERLRKMYIHLPSLLYPECLINHGESTLWSLCVKDSPTLETAIFSRTPKYGNARLVCEEYHVSTQFTRH